MFNAVFLLCSVITHMYITVYSGKFEEGKMEHINVLWSLNLEEIETSLREYFSKNLDAISLGEN